MSPRAPEATHGTVTGHTGHREHRYLMEFWFTKHSMHALRRHRKHSVMSCRLDARPSACDGSLQASSTACDDFFKMSRTLWKIVLGAVSLKKGWNCYTTKNNLISKCPFGTLLVLIALGRRPSPSLSAPELRHKMEELTMCLSVLTSSVLPQLTSVSLTF